jgi:hypothetical protein
MLILASKQEAISIKGEDYDFSVVGFVCKVKVQELWRASLKTLFDADCNK